MEDVPLEAIPDLLPRRRDQRGPELGQHSGKPLGCAGRTKRTLDVLRDRPAGVQATVDLRPDALLRGAADPLELCADLAGGAVRKRPEKVRRLASRMQERKQRT